MNNYARQWVTDNTNDIGRLRNSQLSVRGWQKRDVMSGWGERRAGSAGARFIFIRGEDTHSQTVELWQLGKNVEQECEETDSESQGFVMSVMC